MQIRFYSLFSLFLFVATSASSNDLIVVKDSGAEDINTYIRSIRSSKALGSESSQKRYLEQMKTVSINKLIFPIKTRLKEGVLQPKRWGRNYSLPMNFVLAGCSEQSQNWMLKRYVGIKKYKAVIIIVSCSSVDAYKKMTARFPEFQFMIGNSDVISKELNVSYYPALVTGEGVMQ